MYDFVDRPVQRLNNSGTLLILAMRLWVRQAAAGRCACASLRGLFEERGFGESLDPFRSIMTALQYGARRNLTFRHMSCAMIGEDEAVLLALAGVADPGNLSRHAAARSLVVGARLPQLVDGLNRLAASFQTRGGSPMIEQAGLQHRASGRED